MLPSIFGENLFDDSLSDFFDFGRMMPQVSSELYGKHARNLMKTDVRELDGSYELDVDLPGFKKDAGRLPDDQRCQGSGQGRVR